MRHIGKKAYISYSYTAKTRLVKGEVHSAICTEKWYGEKDGIKYVGKIKNIQMQ